MNKKRWILFGITLTIIFAFMIWRPQKITLRMGVFVGSHWDVPSGDSYQVIDDAIESFEKAYPYINVEYDSGILKEDYSSWLADRILMGEEPDVFMILSEDFNTLSSIGVLKNLNKNMINDKDFDKSIYYQNALDSGMFQEIQYALPYESNPQLMFVNKTLLKKENISLPHDRWTLDDFYSICQQVTKDTNNDGNIDQYGCYDFGWLDSIYSHGATLFNETGTESYFDQEPVKESLNYIKKLNNLNLGHTITSEEFDKGVVAFMPMSFAQYRTYKPYPWRVKKYTSFEWDCVRMPSLEQNQSSEASSLLIGISSRTQHEKESWNLLKALTYNPNTQLEIFQYSQGISPLKSVTKSKEAANEVNKDNSKDSYIDMNLLNDIMEDAINHEQFKKYESAIRLADTRINEMMKEDEDIDIALISLQKEMNIYLNE